MSLPVSARTATGDPSLQLKLYGRGPFLSSLQAQRVAQSSNTTNVSTLQDWLLPDILLRQIQNHPPRTSILGQESEKVVFSSAGDLGDSYVGFRLEARATLGSHEQAFTLFSFGSRRTSRAGKPEGLTHSPFPLHYR